MDSRIERLSLTPLSFILSIMNNFSVYSYILFPWLASYSMVPWFYLSSQRRHSYKLVYFFALPSFGGEPILCSVDWSFLRLTTSFYWRVLGVCVRIKDCANVVIVFYFTSIEQDIMLFSHLKEIEHFLFDLCPSTPTPLDFDLFGLVFCARSSWNPLVTPLGQVGINCARSSWNVLFYSYEYQKRYSW